MDKDVIVNSRITIPASELQFTFARSGGPGGQNVNKVNTKALLRWPVSESEALPEPVRERFVVRHRRRISSDGDLLISSQRYRDQGRNVSDCLDKLKELVVDVLQPPKRRKPTRPTKASKQRRLTAKRQQAQKKQQRKPPKREE